MEVVGAILQNGEEITPKEKPVVEEEYELEEDYELEEEEQEEQVWVSPEDMRRLHNEVVLPRMDCPDDLKEGDEIEVFIFLNKDGYREATVRKPVLQLGEVKLLQIKDSNAAGAFVDIGLKEDLFIPPNEQRIRALAGKNYLVTLQYDPEQDKLFGSTFLPRYFRYRFKSYKKGDEVEIILAEKEDNGMKVIADQKTWAFLPYSETFRHVKLGETYKGWVLKIEPRDMIVSLQNTGLEQIEMAASKVLEYVQNNGGYARLTDQSEPSEIELRLHMSKKTFKRAIGYLQKNGKLVITKRGIKIPKENREA